MGTTTRTEPATGVERSLAPDLARGTALLGIALANSVFYISVGEYGARSRPTGGSALDSAVDLLLVTLVDARWLPLFAALFGYGAVQLARRQAAAGRERRDVRSLQRRRFAWLTVFGAAHLALLFGGDILAIYGVLGFLMLYLLWASNRLVLTIAGLSLLVATPLAALTGLPPLDEAVRMSMPSLLVTDPWQALVLRVTAWPVNFALLSLSALAPMLLGVWAARCRILDEPYRHRRLLLRAVLLGVPTAIAGGLPLGLIAAGLWSPDLPVVALASLVHTLTGFAGALGAGAAFGLLAIRFRDRRGPLVHALVATGRRSLSCYLAQSAVLVACFAAYAGGLGSGLGTAAMAAASIVIWALTVAAADIAARSGRQGPAEVLLRRLAYPAPAQTRPAR